MKKIHAFIFDLSKGGAQGVFVTLVNYLHKSGYEIEIVLQNKENAVHIDEINSDIKITSLDVRNAKKMLPVLIRYMKCNDVEIAIAFSPEIAVNLYLVKRFLSLNTKIIGRNINTLSIEFKHTDSLLRKYLTGTLIKIFYKNLDCVISQSQGMAQDLISNFGVKEEKITVINNPLANKFETETKERCEVSRDNYILYVGRLEKQKGLELLLQAFSRIENKEIKLYLIGSGSKRNELIEISKSLSISDRVEFIDYTSNVISYYRKAKITVLSSYYEGFPNVLIESIACGTPVVSFDMPSGANEIINSDNGILVDYLNVGMMTEGIDKALKQKWNYEKIKESALRFSESVIMNKYLELIEREL